MTGHRAVSILIREMSQKKKDEVVKSRGEGKGIKKDSNIYHNRIYHYIFID